MENHCPGAGQGQGQNQASEAVCLASHHSLRVSPVGKWAPGGQRGLAQLVPSPQLRRRVPQSRAWLRRVTAASPEGFLRKLPMHPQSKSSAALGPCFLPPGAPPPGIPAKPFLSGNGLSLA